MFDQLSDVAAVYRRRNTPSTVPSGLSSRKPESMNEKAVTDALRGRRGPSCNPGLGNHAPHLLVQSLFGPGPSSALLGVQPAR